MYGDIYGYCLLVMKMMCDYLKGICDYVVGFFDNNEFNILDIGSNDGILINYYLLYLNRLVGVDFCVVLYRDLYLEKCDVYEVFFSV